MSLVIGLTGGIGCGKTAVSQMFALHGLPIIDTDDIARSLTAAQGAAIPLLADTFGQQILNPAGALDRDKMRELAFNNPTSKQQLERILHPLIFQQVHHQLQSADQAVPVILVVPLLIESSRYQALVQRIAVVDCSEAQQIARTMARSRLDENMVRAIMRQQSSRAERIAMATDVIDNTGDPGALEPQISQLTALYKTQASARVNL